MKKHLGIAIILLISFSACHTYLFEPVKKKIAGKWLLSDSDSAKKEIWEFKSDGTLEVKINDTISWFVSPQSGDSLPYVEWSVENKITKHYLYTDAWWGHGIKPSEEQIGRWLIVRVSKKKLYISSEFDKKIKGSFQKGFIKQ